MSPCPWGWTESGLGVPFGRSPGVTGSPVKAAAVAGGSLSAVGPEERSSLAGFHLRKMSPAEAPPPFGDKTPRGCLPLSHHSETCQEPRQVPARLPTGPIPPWLPRTTRAAWGTQSAQATPTAAGF